MLSQRKAGVILSYASIGINIVANFLYVPILLKFLGQNEYGLYQLLGAFVTYAAIFDFGLSNAVTRYYCLYKAAGEQEKQENMLFLAKMLFYIIDLFVLFLGIVLYYTLGMIYPQLTQEELAKGKIIFLILVVNVLFTIPSYTNKAILEAEEKFIFSKGLRFIAAILQPVLVVLLVIESPSAITVVIVQTGINLLIVIAQWIYVKFKLKPKAKFHGFDKQLIRGLFAFSLFIFLNTLINELNWQVGKTVLGIMSGTALIATLSAGINIGSAFMQFSYNVSNVFYPRFSVLASYGEDGNQEINNIYIKIGRIQCLVLGLIFSGFIIFGKEFVFLWAGKQNLDAYIIAVILLSSTFFANIGNAGILILQAKKLHQWRTFTLIFAIIGVVISALLIPHYGAIGCVVGTAFSYFFGYVVYLNIIYVKKAKIEVVKFYKTIIPHLITILIVSILGWWLNQYITTEKWLVLIAKIAIYTLIYSILAWFFLMNQYEKNLVKEPVKKVAKKFKR